MCISLMSAYVMLQVFCNGVEVMSVGGTKQEYNVDVYSGNHPFYQVHGGTRVIGHRLRNSHSGAACCSTVMSQNHATMVWSSYNSRSHSCTKS